MLLCQSTPSWAFCSFHAAILSTPGKPIHTHTKALPRDQWLPQLSISNPSALLTPRPVQLLKQFLHVDGHRHVKVAWPQLNLFLCSLPKETRTPPSTLWLVTDVRNWEVTHNFNPFPASNPPISAKLVSLKLQHSIANLTSFCRFYFSAPRFPQ